MAQVETYLNFKRENLSTFDLPLNESQINNGFLLMLMRFLLKS